MRWRSYEMLAYSCPGAGTALVLTRLYRATIPWINRHARDCFGSRDQCGERPVYRARVAWRQRWSSAGSRAQYGVCSTRSAYLSDAERKPCDHDRVSDRDGEPQLVGHLSASVSTLHQ